MQTSADRESDSMSSISSLSDTSDDEEQEKKTVTKKKRPSKKTSGNNSSTKVGVMQFVCIFPVSVMSRGFKCSKYYVVNDAMVD